MPYLWRKLTENQRTELLEYRQLCKRPWHRPPHFEQGALHYHLTAACFEHRPHIGWNPERMADFSRRLIDTFATPPAAWCVLPNHYHILVHCTDLKAAVSALGRLHGRTSFEWNGEENARGRQVWHSVSDRAMRGSDHFWATVNYVHHNPVKHGYVATWTDWPFSSATGFLEEVGRDQAIAIWKAYPVLDYGKGWDD